MLVSKQGFIFLADRVILWSKVKGQVIFEKNFVYNVSAFWDIFYTTFGLNSSIGLKKIVFLSPEVAIWFFLSDFLHIFTHFQSDQGTALICVSLANNSGFWNTCCEEASIRITSLKQWQRRIPQDSAMMSLWENPECRLTDFVDIGTGKSLLSYSIPTLFLS